MANKYIVLRSLSILALDAIRNSNILHDGFYNL